MSLGTKIFFCFLLIFSFCFYYPVHWMVDSLRTRYLEGVEEPIVDQSTLLAAIVSAEMEEGRFDPERLYSIFARAGEREFSARIYDLVKSGVDMYVYITDEKGKVLFHSRDRGEVGKDYSIWRDVYLTLKGEYGARTTQEDENIRSSSVLFVASPIMVHGKLAGVLTVAKPTTNINAFLKKAKPKIIQTGLLALLFAGLLSWVASRWLTLPIKRLTDYADAVKEGRRPLFPTLDNSEIGKMGRAYKKMQETLEGKNYIEQYIQSFTHEVKSPLSAIRGAAELLEEKMEKGQRLRFLANIRNETSRIQLIVDKMLELSSLENLKNLQKTEAISLHRLIEAVVESKRPQLLQKGIKLNASEPLDIMVEGDAFLLQQAIGNLLENSIDFAPESSEIRVEVRVDKERVQIVVEDEGPGIPDFASDKIFMKFFSLKRPQTGRKSTGLGLNFVQEVATLHGGSIELVNTAPCGTKATLTVAGAAV